MLLLIVVELSCYQVYRTEASCVGLGPLMQGRHAWASRLEWPIEAATGHISVGGVWGGWSHGSAVVYTIDLIDSRDIYTQQLILMGSPWDEEWILGDRGRDGDGDGEYSRGPNPSCYRCTFRSSGMAWPKSEKAHHDWISDCVVPAHGLSPWSDMLLVKRVGIISCGPKFKFWSKIHRAQIHIKARNSQQNLEFKTHIPFSRY
jgi:hypothetical protein